MPATKNSITMEAQFNGLRDFHITSNYIDITLKNKKVKIWYKDCKIEQS